MTECASGKEEEEEARILYHSQTSLNLFVAKSLCALTVLRLLLLVGVRMCATFA